MSEIEDRGIPIEDPDDESFDEPDEESGGGGGGLPPIVKMGILALIVIGLGAGAFFVTKNVILPKLTDNEMVKNFKKNRQEKAVAKAAEKALEDKGPVIRHPIPGFTANLFGRRRNIVAFDLLLEVYTEDAVAQLKDREFMVRDAMLIYFGARTLQEVSTREFIVDVRDTIKSMLNSMLDGEPVDTVYFTKFIVQ